MGGRGTYAAGNDVDYTYEINTNFDFAPDEFFENVKILQGTPNSNNHGLPESSHSSSAYIKFYPNGTFHELRLYDKEHCLYLEIAYHNESSLGKGKIQHYHTYDNRFSKNAKGEFIRSRAIRITKDMPIYKQYEKFFRGVNL